MVLSDHIYTGLALLKYRPYSRIVEQQCYRLCMVGLRSTVDITSHMACQWIRLYTIAYCMYD